MNKTEKQLYRIRTDYTKVLGYISGLVEGARMSRELWQSDTLLLDTVLDKLEKILKETINDN